MKELLLDAETLYTREQLHDVLAKVCGFPADYGRNLDALYDLLTAYPAARLTLRHPEMLVAHLGNYGELVLRVLADAGRRKSGVYAECTVTGKTKTEACASVFFLFRLACKPHPHGRISSRNPSHWLRRSGQRVSAHIIEKGGLCRLFS